MEIYSLYIHYTSTDKNWSEERYYIGQNGYETAIKEFDLVEVADYVDIIEFYECKLNDNGKITRTRLIEKSEFMLFGV